MTCWLGRKDRSLTRIVLTSEGDLGCGIRDFLNGGGGVGG